MFPPATSLNHGQFAICILNAKKRDTKDERME